MSRASIASNVKTAQQKQLEQVGNVELPVGPTAEAAAPQPQQAADWTAEFADIPVNEGVSLEGEVDNPLQAEVERQAIPDLAQRENEGPATHPEWLTPAGSTVDPEVIERKPVSTQIQESDGGMLGRAENMANAFQDKKIGFQVKQRGAESPEAAVGVSDIMHQIGAVSPTVDGRPIPDPVFFQVGSLVTENEMAGLTIDPDEAIPDDIERAHRTEEPAGYQKPESLVVTQSQSNAGIGNQIFQEYQRMKGVEVPQKSLPGNQAEVLGATFKEMWAVNNKDLVNGAQNMETGQYEYTLTERGVNVLTAGEAERRVLFPKKNVKPSKQPLPSGKLPGDTGATQTKKASGRVGTPEFGYAIEAAMRNLATVPNVVDTQRGRILLSTLLPVLASRDHNSWQAEIHSIGSDKVGDFNRAQAADIRKREKLAEQGIRPKSKPYDARKNMEKLTHKLAQEVRAIASERKGANYLTYGAQSFNGRISPQQTMFNPTSSKAVRFVTRNATKVPVRKGSRTEQNLRQMYAMMLVKIGSSNTPAKGADMVLPAERERMLNAATPRLRRWGKTLKSALDNSMTNEEYEAVSDAIVEGIPLTDERFPKVRGLQLDPEADKALIDAIVSKGEDGPHFIDGLIDFENYMTARDADAEYHSGFNAYIDGKTNGLAANGIQMGSYETALSTGVTRLGTTNLLDAGDIRDALADSATALLTGEWQGLSPEAAAHTDILAKAVYNNRTLNKKTTMTFGYGKEIESFVPEFEGAIDKAAEDPEVKDAVDVLSKDMTQREIATLLLGKYREALEGVLSQDALDSRRLMRGSAILHAATNSLFKINSATGMELMLGGWERKQDAQTKGPQPDGATPVDQTRQRVYDEGTPRAVDVKHYESEVTSAAARTRTDEEGSQISIPGDYIYGGILPGPVQSLDAATVALSSSGQTWNKLKAASNGKPYLHTIYDAFKLDAAGYDVMLDEINKNWVDASMDWSYLKETEKATTKAMMEFREKHKHRSPKDALSRTERMFMDYMLSLDETAKGGLAMKPYVNRMKNVIQYDEDAKENLSKHYQDANDLKRDMKAVGYDVYNPPATATFEQLRTFVNFLNNKTKLKSQFTKMIDRTESNKKKLREKINREGPVFQYYAH